MTQDRKQRLLSPVLQPVRVRASFPTLVTPGPGLSPASGSNGQMQEGIFPLEDKGDRVYSCTFMPSGLAYLVLSFPGKVHAYGGGRVKRKNILNTFFCCFCYFAITFLNKITHRQWQPTKYLHTLGCFAGINKGCNLIPNFSMACYIFFKQNLNVRFTFMTVNFQSMMLYILFLVSNNLSVKAMNISFRSTLSI